MTKTLFFIVGALLSALVTAYLTNSFGVVGMLFGWMGSFPIGFCSYKLSQKFG